MKELPLGWARTTIGSIAELVNGRAFKPSDWTRTGLPIVRIQNLNRADAAFNHFSGPVAEKHLVRNGDLLFAWSGTPGTSFGAHIWRGPTAVLNQHIFNVRVDPHLIDREFLRLAINQTLEEQIAKAHGGAGLRHVTKGAFEATEIVVPPLNEQRRIVERLRSAEERSAAARSHLDSVITSVETGRSAILQSAYNLTILPKQRRAEYLGGPPVVSVGEIATDLMYGSSAKSTPTGKVPVLRMGNIQDGILDWSNLVYTSDDQEIERYSLQPGDVLFNRTNSPQLVGKTALFRGEQQAIFAGYLIRIRCADRMLPEYLTHCLNSPAGRSYCRAVKSDGVSQSNINSRKLAAFRLPCPSIADQREIIERVEAGLSKLASAAEQARRSRDGIAMLYGRLVNQALAGQLATRNPADEAATKQIQRLAAVKERQKAEDIDKIAFGVEAMQRTVEDILREADDWLPSQEVARLYGITSGAPTEAVEPFYTELRKLDASGNLLSEPIRDGAGTKIGDRLRLKASV
ncbi:restriction endonuclease subunit S [Azospirillum sp. sgz302134]